VAVLPSLSFTPSFIDIEDTVFCTWFETAGKRQELHREFFNPVVLEKYEPSFGFSSMRIERG
jgi:hypothetical protein